MRCTMLPIRHGCPLVDMAIVPHAQKNDLLQHIAWVTIFDLICTEISFKEIAKQNMKSAQRQVFTACDAWFSKELCAART